MNVKQNNGLQNIIRAAGLTAADGSAVAVLDTVVNALRSDGDTLTGSAVVQVGGRLGGAVKRITVYISAYKQYARFIKSVWGGVPYMAVSDGALFLKHKTIDTALEKRQTVQSKSLAVQAVQVGGRWAFVAVVDIMQLTPTIAPRNSKLGDIPSISLPPCITCRHNAPCVKGCYSVNENKVFSNTRNSYYKNLMVYRYNRAEYFNAIRRAVRGRQVFRYHVGGDIPDIEYFSNVVDISTEYPGTTFILFTKQYEIINHFFSQNGITGKPSNLLIIFSSWGRAWRENIPNPFNFPLSEIVGKLDPMPTAFIPCSGCCIDCYYSHRGCFTLRTSADVVGLPMHGAGALDHVEN